MTWKPIAEAPKDGTRIMGRGESFWTHSAGRVFFSINKHRRITWWGKTSHVPLYGWCHGKVENVDLWEPTHWKEL